MLGALGTYLPTKEKVANSFRIRDALQTAAEMRPADGSVQLALGEWFFKVRSAAAGQERERVGRRVLYCPAALGVSHVGARIPSPKVGTHSDPTRTPQVAGIGWVEANAAKLLFGQAPESTYAEARSRL